MNVGSFGCLLHWLISEPMNFLSQVVHLNSYNRANIFQKTFAPMEMTMHAAIVPL